jgi:hypothetical protein
MKERHPFAVSNLGSRLWAACPRLFGLRDHPLRPLHLWMVNASVVLFALGVAVSVHDMHYGCSADLRNRVAPARAMLAGLDPYFYVWQPGMSERLADCYVLPTKMTRPAVPPSVLWFYALSAGLPWGAIRWLYLSLDEAALLALAVLLARLGFHKTDGDRTTAVVLILVAIGCSPIWRMHEERGQYYIYPVLLLGTAFFCLDRKKPAWAGLAMAGAAFLRPTAAPVLLPFLATRKWPVVVGSVVGLAICLGASLPITGIQVYRSSQRSMAGWDEVFGQQYLSGDVETYIIPASLRGERPPTPRVLEGVARPRPPRDLWHPPVFQSYSLLGVSNVLAYAANRLGAGLRLDPESDWRLRVFRVCCAVMLLVGYLALARRGGNCSEPLLCLIGLFFVFLAEYMTPSIRHLYGEVFQILPLGVLGPLLFDRGLPRFYRWCGAVGAGWALLSYAARLAPEGVHFWLNTFSFLGPYSALVFFGGAVLYLARRNRSEEGSSSTTALTFSSHPQPQ